MYIGDHGIDHFHQSDVRQERDLVSYHETWIKSEIKIHLQDDTL